MRQLARVDAAWPWSRAIDGTDPGVSSAATMDGRRSPRPSIRRLDLSKHCQTCARGLSTAYQLGDEASWRDNWTPPKAHSATT